MIDASMNRAWCLTVLDRIMRCPSLGAETTTSGGGLSFFGRSCRRRRQVRINPSPPKAVDALVSSSSWQGIVSLLAPRGLMTTTTVRQEEDTTAAAGTAAAHSSQPPEVADRRSGACLHGPLVSVTDPGSVCVSIPAVPLSLSFSARLPRRRRLLNTCGATQHRCSPGGTTAAARAPTAKKRED